MAVIGSEPKRPRLAMDVYSSSDESESDLTKDPAVETTSTGLPHAINDDDDDPGLIFIVRPASMVHLALALPAVAHLDPPLRQGKKNYN